MTMTRAIFAVPKWQSRAQEPGIFAEFVSEAADGGSALCPVGYVCMYRYLGGVYNMGRCKGLFNGDFSASMNP